VSSLTDLAPQQTPDLVIGHHTPAEPGAYLEDCSWAPQSGQRPEKEIGI
jgi:hypothetical protein